MRRKRLVIITVLSVLLLGTVIGGTWAALRAATKTSKTISTSTLDVKLHLQGSGINKDGNIVYEYKDQNNGVVNETVSASNEGTVDLYLRIKVTRDWYENQKVVKERMNQSIDCDTIGIAYDNEQDWIFPSDTSQQDSFYIYYRKKLSPGSDTNSFMSGVTILKDYPGNTNHYADLSAKLDFDAEAIQTVAAEKAMVKEWGVSPVFDGDGNIISINNQ